MCEQQPTEEQPIIYRLRMRDGTFVHRISETTARRYLRGDGWMGVVRGIQYVTASRPDPSMHESRVTGFDELGPVCHHPQYGVVRIYEPSVQP